MEDTRFFKIIVLGGFALVGPAACSDTVGSTLGDARAIDASDAAIDFPREGPAPPPDVPMDIAPDFPREGADVTFDIAPDFPREGPAEIDATLTDVRIDAAADVVDVADNGDACICAETFPRETAIDWCRIDWCHPDGGDVTDASDVVDVPPSTDAPLADVAPDFPREGPVRIDGGP